MPRFFFNIFDGKDIFDDVGTELNSVNEMHLHMLVLAKAWIDQEKNQAEHWRLEARDENENVVGSMRFGVRLEDA